MYMKTPDLSTSNITSDMRNNNTTILKIYRSLCHPFLILWVLVSLLVSSGVSAARLSGTIVDEEGNPISGVAFRVRFNNDETTDTVHYTNFEGHYDFIVNDGTNA